MSIKNVIGLHYGDEGKGKVVNYLAKLQNNNVLVIKTNGTAQAGHTVVENGKIIINHQFGSALYSPTLLSGDFMFNPVEFKYEWEERSRLNFNTQMAIDIMCSIVTVLDLLKNRSCILTKLHGTVGFGAFETIKRKQHIPLNLYHFLPSYTSKKQLFTILGDIADYYGETDRDSFINFTYESVNSLLIDRKIIPIVNTSIFVNQHPNIIFENGQGLLLSAANWRKMPNLTPSFTGIENVKEFLVRHRLTKHSEVENCYVTRSYITKHGNGEFPEENSELSFDDTTNITNEYQGKLRFGHINVNEFIKRTNYLDKGDLFINHLDQYNNTELIDKVRLLSTTFVKTFKSFRKESEFKI